MWTVKMVKFLFGMFSLSAGLAWMIIGSTLIEFSTRVIIQIPSLWYVVGWTTLVGGVLTCMLGVFLLWHLASDFVKDQTYNYRNPSYDKE